MSNDAQANTVFAYRRLADGSLDAAGEFATGGMGTGASLGSQGSVKLSNDGRFLLVVNAGSNEISIFAVRGARLTLRSKVASGGMMPTSIAERDHLVYALNAGANSNVSGFWLDLFGGLHAIAGSTRSLSVAMPSAAEVAIAPRGLGVVVTEKGTNLIDVFALRVDGMLGDAETHASSGATPYGFDFSSSGTLVVSEATGAVSSYRLGKASAFSTISASVADNQSAPCWVVVTHDGRFAYTANAGSSSISGYSLAQDGALHLLDANGVTGDMGQNAKPLDMALDQAQHLYAIDAANHVIDGFAIGEKGSLTPVTSATGLPSTLVGVAAM
jgi:6-phosphogluconolactonase (cycloisomerase 2 family)